MGTITTTPFSISRVTQRDEPTNILTDRHQSNGKASHDGEPMTKAEQAEMAELREIVHQVSASVTLLTKSATQAQAQPQVQTNGQSRSIDTLRRDIGIFAILLGMMLQTGAAFYWAGGVTRGQEAARETIKQVQDEQAYHRAQLQLIDGKLQKIEGRETERENQQNNGKRR